MRKTCILLVFSALIALPGRASADELKLTIHNGLVTLVADNVPVSAIMSEWARIGRTQVVNGERVPGRVSLQIVDVPERRALDILLRSVSGYMTAERTTALAGPSAFERIMILPTSTPPANAPSFASPPPAFVPRPVPVAPQPPPDADDEGPMVMPPGMEPDAPTPVPVLPGQGPEGQPGAPGVPNAPLTAPRPGQLPAPAPQQPVPFGTPNQKPPGGGGPGGYVPDREEGGV